MFMKKVMCLLLMTLYASLAYAEKDDPYGWNSPWMPSNMVCAAKNKIINFSVTFNGLYENAIIIRHAKTSRPVMTFNNYYQNGASGRWQSGAGNWSTQGGDCYYVDGYHKNGKPDQGKSLLKSKLRRENNLIGFEDATDNDYRDAVVSFNFITKPEPPKPEPPKPELPKPEPPKPEPPKPVPPLSPIYIERLQNTDISGNDYRIIFATIDECEQACLSDERCFSFNIGVGGTKCWMKNTDGPVIALMGGITGIKRHR